MTTAKQNKKLRKSIAYKALKAMVGMYGHRPKVQICSAENFKDVYNVSND